MLRIVALSSLLVFTSSACASMSQNQKDGTDLPTDVEVSVSGLRDDEREELESQLAEIDGISGMESRNVGDAIVYAFTYRGDVQDLREDIADIPHPGLETKKVVARLDYRGFDNRPPRVSVVSPDTDRTINEREVEIVVESGDEDVERIEVAGGRASKRSKGLYQRTVTLDEGENKVQVRAVDRAGNETNETITINVDTTPPEIDATVKIVVEGKVEPGSTVFVEGREVDVNMFGKWKTEVAVSKGQETVEVVAIDENGNKKVENKPIRLP
jgi:hypothetical protein